MARVGLDVDGVLADFHDAFIHWARKNNFIAKDLDVEEPRRWEFYLDLGLTKKEFARAMNEGANEMFINSKVLEDAAAVTHGLKQDGHTIVIITNRYDTSRDVTDYWLKLHGIHFDELHHVKDKTEIEVDFHVDDKPENVRAMNQAGVCAYLMDQSWNYGEWDLDRIYTLRDYRNKIRQIANLDVSRLKQEHPRTAFLNRLLAGQQARLGAETVDELSEAQQEKYLVGEVRTTSATGGQKGVKPEQYDQIPVRAEAELARHFGYGAKKYAAHNFRKGYEWSKNYNALRRHLAAFWGGQDYDLHEPDCPEDCTNHLPDSKHIIAVAWHALVLATFMDEHPEFDDRYKGENQ